tara:strand:- start:12572 stop:13114 length:543 start_codon:yes stop_codon:yes gene_type:complete
MFIIDKSHSKKDIIELLKCLNVVIDKSLSKGKIVNDIDLYIDKAIYNNKIKNKTELIEYLQTKTTKQRPNIQEKNDIMYKSKRIIKYCNSYCNLSDVTYLTHEEVYNDIISISKWGDIPSVRRACRLYNSTPYHISHVNPIISAEVKEEMDNNKTLKQTFITTLKIKRGTKDDPILVSFN